MERFMEACIEEGNPTLEYVLGVNELEVILRSQAGTGKVGLIHEVDLSNVPENVPQQRWECIIKFMLEKPEITAKKLSEKLNVTEKTLKRDVAQLSGSKIHRVGSDKIGHWEVIK